MNGKCPAPHGAVDDLRAVLALYRCWGSNPRPAPPSARDAAGTPGSGSVCCLPSLGAEAAVRGCSGGFINRSCSCTSRRYVGAGVGSPSVKRLAFPPQALPWLSFLQSADSAGSGKAGWTSSMDSGTWRPDAERCGCGQIETGLTRQPASALLRPACEALPVPASACVLPFIRSLTWSTKVRRHARHTHDGAAPGRTGSAAPDDRRHTP